MESKRISDGRLFISRAGEDREVALRINQILQEAGFSTFIQDADFGHASFMARMAEGFDLVEGGGRLIALLSNHFQEKEHCLKEARFPLIDDPQNRLERLIVFRIDECAPRDFLKDIPYVDLVTHLHDSSALECAVIHALRHRTGVVTDCIRADPKIEQLMMYLENEDEADTEKALNWIALIIIGLAGALIAFDYLVAGWNWLFETSYYALFGTGEVIILSLVLLAALFVGAYICINDLAGAIEKAGLTTSQLREFKKRVQANDWKSKGLMKTALSIAIRRLTSGRR